MTAELEAKKRELEAAQKAIAQQIADIDAAATREREEAHADLVRQCRTAKDEHARIHRETEDAQQAAIHSQNRVKSAQFYLDIAKAQRPKPEAYPTRQEIETWREDVSAKERELSAAMEADATAWEKCDRLQHERREARRVFDDLAEWERNLRHEIEFASRPAARNPATSFVMSRADNHFLRGSRY